MQNLILFREILKKNLQLYLIKKLNHFTYKKNSKKEKFKTFRY